MRPSSFLLIAAVCFLLTGTATSVEPIRLTYSLDNCSALERRQKELHFQDFSSASTTNPCAERPGTGNLASVGDWRVLAVQSFWWDAAANRVDKDVLAIIRLAVTVFWWAGLALFAFFFMLIFPPAFIIGRYVFNCCGGRLPTHSACCPDGDERAVFSGYSAGNVICHKVVLCIVSGGLILLGVQTVTMNTDIFRRTQNVTYAALPPSPTGHEYKMVAPGLGTSVWNPSTPSGSPPETTPLLTVQERWLVEEGAKAEDDYYGDRSKNIRSVRINELVRFILLSVGVGISMIVAALAIGLGVANLGIAFPGLVFVLAWTICFSIISLGQTVFYQWAPAIACAAFVESIQPVAIGQGSKDAGCNVTALRVAHERNIDFPSTTDASVPSADLFDLRYTARNVEQRCAAALGVRSSATCAAVKTLCITNSSAGGAQPLFRNCSAAVTASCLGSGPAASVACELFMPTLEAKALIAGTNATMSMRALADLPILNISTDLSVSVQVAADYKTAATSIVSFGVAATTARHMARLALTDTNCNGLQSVMRDVVYYRICDADRDVYYTQLSACYSAFIILSFFELIILVKGIKRFRSPFCYPFPLAPMQEGYAAAHETETIDEAQIKRQAEAHTPLQHPQRRGLNPVSTAEEMTEREAIERGLLQITPGHTMSSLQNPNAYSDMRYSSNEQNSASDAAQRSGPTSAVPVRGPPMALPDDIGHRYASQAFNPQAMDLAPKHMGVAYAVDPRAPPQAQAAPYVQRPPAKPGAADYLQQENYLQDNYPQKAPKAVEYLQGPAMGAAALGPAATVAVRESVVMMDDDDDGYAPHPVKKPGAPHGHANAYFNGTGTVSQLPSSDSASGALTTGVRAETQADPRSPHIDGSHDDPYAPVKQKGGELHVDYSDDGQGVVDVHISDSDNADGSVDTDEGLLGLQ